MSRAERNSVASQWLEGARLRGMLNALDVLLARQLADSAEAPDDLHWLVALLSYQHRQGHVCIDLARPPKPAFDQPDCPWSVPDLVTLQDLDSALLGSAESRATLNRPLILDGTRVYLRRHWCAEQAVAEALRARCQRLPGTPDQLKTLISDVFGKTYDSWQVVAALNCALHQFGVITGGPGTGKTWTVTRMLALHCLRAVNAGQPLPNIAMAAPTGKAAARLTEALQAALPSLPVNDQVRDALPGEAVTLHRLLAMGMDGKPRHHFDNPLPWDLVVVDEASMIDLGLMAQLINALPEQACLYLVGDRDQLASVQAGAVFADICGDARNLFCEDVQQSLQQAGAVSLEADNEATRMDSAVVRLQTVHRFGQDSAIAQLSRAVREQALEEVGNMAAAEQPDLQWLPARQSTVLDVMLDAFRPLVEAARAGEDASVLLQQFTHFRVLCATRRGELGVEQLNQYCEQALHRTLGIAPGHWFIGKTLMLRQNDWNQRLFNGDIGVVVANPDDHGGRDPVRVAFNDAQDGVRLVAPSRLPEWESAWAMTIHKSQGSEFDRVLLVLPEDDSPILSRELLYTGITRARSLLHVAATQAQVQTCMQRPVYRASGLADRLRNPG